jgi:hypothetical protein
MAPFALWILFPGLLYLVLTLADAKITWRDFLKLNLQENSGISRLRHNLFLDSPLQFILPSDVIQSRYLERRKVTHRK